MMGRWWIVSVCGVLAATSPVRAQGIAVDEAVARARVLVEAGNGRAGRLVLDSLVDASGVATPALGELLYWRGLLAESGTDAERDWKRLLLEVPMSPRAEDALLRLAQLEQMRGRPAASRELLERLARQYREPASQARAHFWLAKAWFDEKDLPRACGALDVVRREVPANAVELRAQAEDLRVRCRGVTAVAPIAVVADGAPAAALAATPVADRTALVRDSIARAAAVRDSVAQVAAARDAAIRDAAVRDAAARDAAARDSAARDSAARDSAARNVAARADAVRPPAPPPASTATAAARDRAANARFSVQLAALNTRAQAEQFAQRFVSRGVDARVDGTSAPFRVRTGYFATRAQANARLAELKARGFDGFVAELTP